MEIYINFMFFLSVNRIFYDNTFLIFQKNSFSLMNYWAIIFMISFKYIIFIIRIPSNDFTPVNLTPIKVRNGLWLWFIVNNSGIMRRGWSEMISIPIGKEVSIGSRVKIQWEFTVVTWLLRENVYYRREIEVLYENPQLVNSVILRETANPIDKLS